MTSVLPIKAMHERLNAEQRRAVLAPPGHQLVLAGAGTGKTTVLTARFAQLVSHHGTSPYSVLTVTFTNRAAGEMRERIEHLLGRSMNGLWVGTFHSIALRMLRYHADVAGLGANFQIIDANDQKSLIKRLMRQLNIDENSMPVKRAVNLISRCKEECLRAADIADGAMLSDDRPFSSNLIMIYQAYEELCEQESLVDFAEMLLRCYELLQRHPEVLAEYRQRFDYLLVDEFQDTNAIQYKWLRLLAGDAMHIMVVGDDDQSIYSWRGAQAANMQDFRTHFKDVQLVRLEQNYRSSATILDAANAVIANNQVRIGKTLRTDKGRGAPILVCQSDSDRDEAGFIVEQTIRWQMDEGHRYDDCAVLYRSHAQSRLLEQACLERGVAYKVYGGMPFFSRAEVKTTLAYLRLLVAPDSNEAFSRVVNLPPRGIGTKTQQQLRAQADAQGISLWAASTTEELAKSPLSGRAVAALGRFHELIDDLCETTMHMTLPDIADTVIRAAKLEHYYGNEGGEIGRTRLENLQELINACSTYEPEESHSPLETLRVFLNEVTLQTSVEGSLAGDANDDALQLMTMHSAKGLEFPVVFLSGLEEGLLPHISAVSESGSSEEERRLLYVGITRAQKRLCFSYAMMRQVHGVPTMREPSSFLLELPHALLETYGDELLPTDNAGTHSDTIPDFESPMTLLHKTVYHNKFGSGRVIAVEGDGERARAKVKFHDGYKWLVLAYANLQLSETL